MLRARGERGHAAVARKQEISSRRFTRPPNRAPGSVHAWSGEDNCCGATGQPAQGRYGSKINGLRWRMHVGSTPDSCRKFVAPPKSSARASKRIMAPLQEGSSAETGPANSLDDLVGAAEQSGRHRETDGLAVLRLMINSTFVDCCTGKRPVLAREHSAV